MISLSWLVGVPFFSEMNSLFLVYIHIQRFVHWFPLNKAPSFPEICYISRNQMSQMVRKRNEQRFCGNVPMDTIWPGFNDYEIQFVDQHVLEVWIHALIEQWDESGNSPEDINTNLIYYTQNEQVTKEMRRIFLHNTESQLELRELARITRTCTSGQTQKLQTNSSYSEYIKGRLVLLFPPCDRAWNKSPPKKLTGFYRKRRVLWVDFFNDAIESGKPPSE